MKVPENAARVFYDYHWVKRFGESRPVAVRGKVVGYLWAHGIVAPLPDPVWRNHTSCYGSCCRATPQA